MVCQGIHALESGKPPCLSPLTPVCAAACRSPRQDPEFDAELTAKFGDFVKTVRNGAEGTPYASWLESVEGRVALIIALDQFSRNIFRNTPDSFAADPAARKLTKAFIASGEDEKQPLNLRGFIYMPLMHSEEYADHELAIERFEHMKATVPETDAEAAENYVNFEHMHAKIIKRFGRYPHRNEILGRETTPEEAEFLKEENSSF